MQSPFRDFDYVLHRNLFAPNSNFVLRDECRLCGKKNVMMEFVLVQNQMRKSSGWPSIIRPIRVEELMVHYLHSERIIAKFVIPHECLYNIQTKLHGELIHVLRVLASDQNTHQTLPSRLEDAVDCLQIVAHLGPIQRRLKQFDILRMWDQIECVGGLVEQNSKKEWDDKLAQRWHKMSLPMACCIIRAVRYTLPGTFPPFFDFLLRSRLCILFGERCSSGKARNGSFLIRKRTFEISEFRFVLSREVGLDLRDEKDRDAIIRRFKKENYAAGIGIDQMLWQLYYLMTTPQPMTFQPSFEERMTMNVPPPVEQDQEMSFVAPPQPPPQPMMQLPADVPNFFSFDASKPWEQPSCQLGMNVGGGADINQQMNGFDADGTLNGGFGMAPPVVDLQGNNDGDVDMEDAFLDGRMQFSNPDGW